MPRVSGIDIPDSKPIGIAITRLYGVGRKNAVKILALAEIDGHKKASQLSPDELLKISKVLENYTVEGDLRREVSENIKRLKEIGSYRGSRHTKGLPARGQRTRSNARTKRGKRVTIGAQKKEAISTKTAADVKKAPAKK